MKRFWKDVSTEEDESGYRILLDERPVRTPRRQPLALPTLTLADAVAGEWRAVGEEIDPARLPLTGIANAAQDHVAPDPADFAAALSRYGESDLLCYRSTHPAPLVTLQETQWGPPLRALEERYDISFRVTDGIGFVAQPEPTLSRMAAAYASRSKWELAALQPVVTITGSAILAPALADGLTEADAVFDAGHLDELWQESQWGADDDARTAREARRHLFDAAVRFLGLLR